MTDKSLGTPLRLKGEAAPDPASVKREMITETTIYDCIAAPQPSDIRRILSTLLSTSDVTSCLTTISTLKSTKGLALADILYIEPLAVEIAGLDDIVVQERDSADSFTNQRRRDVRDPTARADAQYVAFREYRLIKTRDLPLPVLCAGNGLAT